MRMRTPLLLFLLGWMVSIGPLEAMETKTIAQTSTPPVIDGKLDDLVWASAQKFTDFKTYEPDYGKVPSQRTEAYMTYDSENFYFGVRCYDTEPDKIKAAVSKRDDIFQDDLIGIILDTFNDMQSGFGFLINPLGIQGDGMMGVEGNLEPSLDMVWFSKGRIDELGYTVECRIPLKSIRFPNKKVLPMRILFFRFFIRTMDKLDFTLSLSYSDLFRDADGEKIYDYILLRSRNTFQVNKYLFLRGIVEYNFYRDRLTVDTLASFTYIPGTVIHVG